MRVLILSCGTGGGHHAAANALVEELTRRGHQVMFLDPFQLSGENTASLVGNAYIRLVQRSPALFGVLYFLGNAYRRLPIHSPIYWANGKCADQMEAFLREHPFDVILMTHLFPAHILTHLRKRNVPLPKTILVSTDYTCIPLIEESDCDYYITPAPELTEEFCSYGIPRERILPYGIPVLRRFREGPDKAAARASLGLLPDKTYLLLCGGSMGAGKLTQAVQLLLDDGRAQGDSRLVVICGSNQTLYSRMCRRWGSHPGIRILGRTDRMADYMRACDLLITKPGGLSSTESAAAEVPTIQFCPIPGCETRNARFFSQQGMSLYVKKPDRRLLEAVEALTSAEAVAAMNAAQRRCPGTLAADRICDFAESLCRR